jgi:hypothetical protein
MQVMRDRTNWIYLTAETLQDACQLGGLMRDFSDFQIHTADGQEISLGLRVMTLEEEKLLRMELPQRRLAQKHDRLLHYVRRLDCSCPDPGAAPVCERCQVLADVTDWQPGGEATEAAQCRRCSECPDYSHHWLEDPGSHHAWDFVCKHCPAKGSECPDCHGSGCDPCNGEGVILINGKKQSDPVE